MIAIMVLSRGLSLQATRTHAAEVPLADSNPQLLQAIAAAGWTMANAKATLPQAQVVQEELLETQDFAEYAYDGGALRVLVRPERGERDIFALIVDTRQRRYQVFAGVQSCAEYDASQDGPYLVLIRKRSIDPTLFEALKARTWTADELHKRLGPASFRWHLHGSGFEGMTYVAEGLEFIGNPPGPRRKATEYQIYDATESYGGDLPPITAVANLDYKTAQARTQNAFAERIATQRKKIDEALARGLRSPSGRFLVAQVNVAGAYNNEQIIIRERGMPERHYPAGYFIEDDSYRWLDDRTVLYQIWWPTGDVEFKAMDALTGAATLVTKVSYEDPGRVTDFGVSGKRGFWYRTDDGKAHEVVVPTSK